MLVLISFSMFFIARLALDDGFLPFMNSIGLIYFRGSIAMQFSEWLPTVVCTIGRSLCISIAIVLYYLELVCPYFSPHQLKSIEMMP